MVRSSYKDELPELVSLWLKENGAGDVKSITSVGGGCINHGVRLFTSSGTNFFLKTNQHSSPDMFTREAEGLDLLRVEGGPRVPHVYLIDEDFLLLEDLSPSAIQENYWEEFGMQLANVHRNINAKFGLAEDNYIGNTWQVNQWTEDGFEFFANHRLIYQAELAARRSLLSYTEAQKVTSIAKRLPDWLPVQKAVLLHGDLWSGNVISGPIGEPAIIDPAVYYGWAEADLAMTILFGSFPKSFYVAYEEATNLDSGWRGRLEIYNLYHLLNHLNIFGVGYHSRVMGIINKYT